MLITRIKCDTIAVHVQSLSGISSATLTPSDWAVKATIISLLLSNHSSRPFLPRLDLFPQTNTTAIERPEAAEQSSAVQLVIWEVGSLEMSDRCPMTHARLPYFRDVCSFLLLHSNILLLKRDRKTFPVTVAAAS